MRHQSIDVKRLEIRLENGQKPRTFTDQNPWLESLHRNRVYDLISNRYHSYSLRHTVIKISDISVNIVDSWKEK